VLFESAQQKVNKFQINKHTHYCKQQRSTD